MSAIKTNIKAGEQSSFVLAVIPARGGSVGLPGKNIRDLCGKPLIAWTIEAALAAKAVDRVIVSTDSEEIASVALNFGADVPFRRPSELAQSTTPGVAPVLHALENLPGYDIVVLLQPTSPLRTASDIDLAINQLVETGADSCISVTESHPHPNWMKRIVDGRLTSFLHEEIATTRQQLPPVFALNGAIYATKTKILQQQKTLHQLPHTVPYVMPEYRSHDIDNETDFLICETLMAASFR